MVIAPPLRVVYFGTPEFAVPPLRALIASRHLVAAIVSQPDRPRGRGHKVVATSTSAVGAAHGIPVLQPTRIKDDAFHSAIRALRPDLGVVAAYGRILPDALLQIPRLGMINVHASLLPKYRGAAPVHRAVIAGDGHTGVTIMRVVTELDAGPMFASRTIAIGEAETSPEVEHRLAEAGAQLLLQVVEQLAHGTATETPQDPAQATFAPKIAREESSVAWTRPAREIVNLIRGLQPWPLVACRIDGARYLLHGARVVDLDRAGAPGTIVKASGDDLVIAAGDGPGVQVLTIQPEGRRPMSAREFLAGRRLTPGTSVEPA